MAFPNAAGTPSYAGTMIPEIWSPKLLRKFYASTVLSDIANTDYEGEIRDQGDTVHIRTTPDITIRNYVKGQKLQAETPEPTVVDLLIDKGKYWNFISDDVTKAQADYAYIENWTTDAAEQLKIEIERPIWADIPADAHAKNKGLTAGKIKSNINLGTTGTPVQLTKANVLDKIIDCARVLGEQNVPNGDGQRFMIIPEWAWALLMKSDLKNASIIGDTESVLRNGKIGRIGQFTFYMSNLLQDVTDGANTVTNILFGHKSALTFATQLVKSEGPIRGESYFGDQYRGLQVYGYKVIKPESLGVLYAYE